MRRLVAFMVFVAVCGGAAAQTVDDVIALARKGTGAEILIAFVERAESPYDLSAADVRRLHDSKVPDEVIAAMLRHRPDGDIRIGLREDAGPAALSQREEPRAPIALFFLKGGRALIVVNYIATADEYAVKTDKGKLVIVKKADVESIQELDQVQVPSRVVGRHPWGEADEPVLLNIAPPDFSFLSEMSYMQSGYYGRPPVMNHDYPRSNCASQSYYPNYGSYYGWRPTIIIPRVWPNPYPVRSSGSAESQGGRGSSGCGSGTSSSQDGAWNRGGQSGCRPGGNNAGVPPCVLITPSSGRTPSGNRSGRTSF